MQVAVLVGGLGTRLGKLTEEVPKPMVLVGGRPFLEYEVELLKKGGIDDFVLCVGHLGEKVERHFGDGTGWGVKMRYSYDGPRLLGPAGAVKAAEPLLGDRFFVTYGDAYLRLNYKAMMGALLDSGRLALMAVLQNRNRYGNSDVEVEGDSVVRYDKRAKGKGMEWVNFGVTAMRKAALSLLKNGERCEEEEFYGELIRRRQLGAFRVEERFYEIGTPASLAEFERFITAQGRHRL